MNTDLLQDVLTAYGLKGETIQAFGRGLINRTWKVNAGSGCYILQKINDKVFRKPQDIAYNIRSISDHLRRIHPAYLFVTPIRSKTGEDSIFVKEEGWFRLFPFIADTHTIDVVANPSQAYKAAAQFGRFTRLLSGFDVGQLKITIPDFHNLNLRYEQFLKAIEEGDQKRLQQSKDLIHQLIKHKHIVEQYQSIIHDPEFKLRVTHHDTKINNVLFDKDENPVCIIDLDTLMPGYFISDVGDMIRTYVCPVNEEETDLDKISIRKDFYQAIVKGYSSEMNDELSAKEKNHFLYAGKFMIYMQALRFLSDYLNNDVYYGANYPQHNLSRAMNQARLLELLIRNENDLASGFGND